MSLLSLRGLTVRRGTRAVLRDVSLDLRAGELVGLIGPNGAGKTTLMRAALGLLPHEGHVSLAALPPAARARAAAFLPQQRQIAWPMTVERIVTLGRTPWLARGNGPDLSGAQAVARAIDHMGLEAFRHRLATELSGGEQARVLIARALAQDTPLLLADEPAAGLDPRAQIATMQVFADLARTGHGVLVSLHDLGLAARHCTRLVVLSQGQKCADGPPKEVLTPALLQNAFGLRAWYRDTDEGPVFQPLEVV